ncbi:Tetratricopeptide repeat-containing protein [Amycolatopsis xylanica]|uniref:Tetratricopeptide repeat-containing protein n=1 Tax=Amycolatopsis xylanica TaxID=589385 RepID=A0A1H2U6S7_9PSEU|nr:tetratricopeptide repeat protein [Amycolatopsis xylanica]SDW51866.1 Tetratricopeptide repeat-containing protein [Amycolatopsis xylanica]
MDGVTTLSAARAALNAGDLDAAFTEATRAVELLTAESGPKHPDIANAQLTLASVHERAGRFAAAREVAAVAVTTLDGFPRSGVREVGILRVRSQAALANLDRILGDLAGARTRLKLALSIAEAEAVDGRETASVHNALGIVGKFSGDFEEAEAHYLLALECHEGNPLGVAAVLHNLGGLEHERGRPERGIPWAENGLALRRRVRPEDHPEVAADLGALGSLYLSAGRLEDAERAYLAALEVFEAEYEIAVVRGNLAHLRARQGKVAEAEASYRAALAGKIAALGEDHPDVAVTLHNLAVLLLDSGREREGRELLLQAERLMTGRLPDDHPRVLAVRRTVATL